MLLVARRTMSAPLAAAFAQFKDAGVQDLVLDLRYNGGGLVQVAGELASYLGGDRARGQTFATLLYNDRRANQNNERFAFAAPAAALSSAWPFQRTMRWAW